MWVGIREMGRLIAPRWLELAAGGVAIGSLGLIDLRLQAHAARRRRERRVEEELAAYAGLDLRLLVAGDGVDLAKQVSRLVAERSVYRRVAVFFRDAEGRLIVAGSAGMDDATVQALNAWGDGVMAAERVGGNGVRRGEGGLGVRVGAKSFAVVLGKGSPEGHSGAIVIPMWTAGGRVLGALAVGADGLMSVRRSLLAKSLEPMEALAFKVERAMENAELAARLRRAEKLAGLGLVVGGMAHALNDPLTAVLGFAELIVATSGEGRVKEDAGIIVREALRMRQTVETLLEFWRPAGHPMEPVDMTGLVRELARACAEKLEGRGVRLLVQAGEEAAIVRGSRERLRQMMEHLLNNAAQALADVGIGRAEGEPVIRVSVSVSGNVGGERVHLVVSDTGPGFSRPAEVFEPCDSVGLGLSVCYGIVQEHGGEISAFNLHPHGAGVAVELPMDSSVKKGELVAGERIYSASA